MGRAGWLLLGFLWGMLWVSPLQAQKNGESTTLKVSNPSKSKTGPDDWIRERIPHFTLYEDKARLKIWLPWREIYLPAPRAFISSGGRPPYDPNIAWQRSIIFPGWGQIYNRSYWKVPIIYAVYGAGVWWIIAQNNEYKLYRQLYLQAIDDDPSNDPPELEFIDPEGLRIRRENARRNRDFTIILMVIVHTLQTVEAYVDAHLKEFDVGEDLSMKVRPGNQSVGLGYGGAALQPGVSISFRLSK